MFYTYLSSSVVTKFLIFVLQISAVQFCIALRVFLINPNNFDHETKVIIPNWIEQDYTNDVDGGVLIFDGALAENTTLVIKNMKAKRIEVNATLSRGCTLLIEKNQLVSSKSSSDLLGGLLVAPTVFTSSDGTFSCSKTTRSASPSPNHKIHLVIKNNIFSTVSGNALLGISWNDAQDLGFANLLAIYNPVICYKNSGVSVTPASQYVVSDLTSLEVVIVGCVFKFALPVNNGSNFNDDRGAWLSGLNFYNSHRVTGKAMETFFTSESSSAASSLYEPFVPLSSFILTNNTFELFSSGDTWGMVLGMSSQQDEWPSKNFFYLNRYYYYDNNDIGGKSTVAAEGVKWDFSQNSFNLTGSANAQVMTVGMFGHFVAEYSTWNAPFSFEFHNQRQILMNAATMKIINFDLLSSFPFVDNFRATLKYFNNNQNVVLNFLGTDKDVSVAGFYLSHFSRPDTEVFVENSTFNFGCSAAGLQYVLALDEFSAKTVAVNHVSIELLLVTRTSDGGSEFGFLEVTNLGFIGNVTGTNNIYSEAKFNKHVSAIDRRMFMKQTLNFGFYSILSPAKSCAQITGANLRLPDCGIGNFFIAKNSFEVECVQNHLYFIHISSSVNRIDHISILENNATVNGYIGSYFAYLSVSNDFLMYRSASFQRNVVNVSAAYNPSDQPGGSWCHGFNLTNLILNSSSSSTASTPATTGLRVQDNFYTIRACGKSSFFIGGFMAVSPSSSSFDVDYRVVVVRNNNVDIAADSAAVFYAFPAVATDLPVFWFNIKVIVATGNQVSLTSRTSCSFLSSFLEDKSASTFPNLLVTVPVRSNFFISDNVVRLNASFNSFQLTMGNMEIENIFLNNNTFLSWANPEPMIAPDIDVSLNLLKRTSGWRFSLFSLTKITKIFTSVASSSAMASINAKFSINRADTGSIGREIPICSLFNGRMLRGARLRSIIFEPIPFIVSFMFGSGVPISVGGIEDSAQVCFRTTSETLSLHRPPRRRHTITGLETRSVSVVAVSPPMVLKVSQPVASALVASDVTQAIAVVSVAVLGSISSSPVLGFNVGRQQAMTNFAKKSLEGDCRGLLPATTVNEFEERISNPLGLGDSPTQMSIGGSEKLMSYYVGAVVGDFILTFGLVLLSQGIGLLVSLIYSRKRGQNASRSASFLETMSKVFATSYVSLTLFFCLSFLLTPILSSSLIVLVAAMNDPKLKDHEVGVGLKILCIILAVIFCAVAVYFVTWSVFVRNQRKEKYRFLKKKIDPPHSRLKKITSSLRTEPFVQLLEYLLKPEGEWCYPNPTSIQQQNLANLMNRSKKNNTHHRQLTLWYHNFLIAEPTFESYRGTIWFCSIEIISAILLAFPPFFAQFASSGKGSCLVQGIMLLLILLVYSILLIWKNPFKLRILRIMNPVLALQQLMIVLLSLIMAGKRNSNDDGESPSWLWKVIIVPMAFSNFMSFCMIGAALFPFVGFVHKIITKFTSSKSSLRELKSDDNRSSSRRQPMSDRVKNTNRNSDQGDQEMMEQESTRVKRASNGHRHDHKSKNLHQNHHMKNSSDYELRRDDRNNDHQRRHHPPSPRGETNSSSSFSRTSAETKSRGHDAGDPTKQNRSASSSNHRDEKMHLPSARPVGNNFELEKPQRNEEIILGRRRRDCGDSDKQSCHQREKEKSRNSQENKVTGDGTSRRKIIEAIKDDPHV